MSELDCGGGRNRQRDKEGGERKFTARDKL